MIPTVIVFGLVAGRWWRATLALATIGWPLLLWTEGITGRLSSLAVGAALALVNAAVGVTVHQAVLVVVRRLGPETGES